MVPMMKNHEAPGTIGDVGFHCPPVMMVMRQWNIPYQWKFEWEHHLYMVDFPLAKSHVHSCLATENAARSDARDTGG